MKLTVMHIMNSISPTSTGYEIASSLNTDVFKVIIVAFSGTTQIDDSTIISLGAKSKFDLGAIARLDKIISNSKVDILHTHHNISGSIARLLAKKNRVRVIVDTEHGSHSSYRFLGNLINDLTLFLSDLIINVSYWVNESYALWERLLVSKHKMTVLYNGVDLKEVRNAMDKEPSGESIRVRYSISQDDIVLLHAARLTEVKNQANMIKGFAKAYGKYPKLKLVIAGGGELRILLENIVRELNIKSRVVFTGLISREEVYQLMQQADGFVMNSHSEGLSVALLEAMAFGLPCILSNISSFRETTKGIVIGEFIERDDADAVADAFSRFMDAGIKMRNLWGERARILAWSDYSLNNTIDNYERIYIDLFRRKNSNMCGNTDNTAKDGSETWDKCGKVIEFFGLPGSGKSTLAARVALTLEKSNIHYNSFMYDFSRRSKLFKAAYKLSVIAGSILTVPRKSVNIIRMIAATKQKYRKELIRIVAQQFLIINAIRRSRHNNERLMLDEGIFHLLWSICLNSEKQPDIKSFLAETEMPDFVVVLKLQEGVVEQRLKHRNFKHRRLDRYVNMENAFIVKKSVELFNQILDYMQSSGVKMLILDNSLSEARDTNSDLIVNSIIKL